MTIYVNSKQNSTMYMFESLAMKNCHLSVCFLCDLKCLKGRDCIFWLKRSRHILQCRSMDPVIFVYIVSLGKEKFRPFFFFLNGFSGLFLLPRGLPLLFGFSSTPSSLHSGAISQEFVQCNFSFLHQNCFITVCWEDFKQNLNYFQWAFRKVKEHTPVSECVFLEILVWRL